MNKRSSSTLVLEKGDFSNGFHSSSRGLASVAMATFSCTGRPLADVLSITALPRSGRGVFKRQEGRILPVELGSTPSWKQRYLAPGLTTSAVGDVSIGHTAECLCNFHVGSVNNLRRRHGSCAGTHPQFGTVSVPSKMSSSAAHTAGGEGVLRRRLGQKTLRCPPP